MSSHHHHGNVGELLLLLALELARERVLLLLLHTIGIYLLQGHPNWDRTYDGQRGEKENSRHLAKYRLVWSPNWGAARVLLLQHWVNVHM